jgi:hypothetical protein
MVGTKARQWIAAALMSVGAVASLPVAHAAAAEVIPPTGAWIVVNVPVACPFWYLDGTQMRPRAQQQGCVLPVYDFVLPGQGSHPQYALLLAPTKRCSNQGCYQRQLTQVSIPDSTGVLRPYGPGANTWVKVGDRP